MEDFTKLDSGSSNKVDALISTFKELRDDIDKTTTKLVYLSGIVEEPNSSFEEPNLFS